jgi:hypothetical protein
MVMLSTLGVRSGSSSDQTGRGGNEGRGAQVERDVSSLEDGGLDQQNVEAMRVVGKRNWKADGPSVHAEQDGRNGLARLKSKEWGAVDLVRQNDDDGPGQSESQLQIGLNYGFRYICSWE